MLKKAGFFTFFSLFSRLSLTFLHFLGIILGNFMYFMPNKAKKVTQTNILLAFSDKNNKFKHDLVKKSLIESSKTLLETPRVWYLNKKNLEVDFQVENEHLIKGSLDKNKGVIVFTPHLGNVEVIVNFLGSRHSSVIPYKLSKIDYVDEFIKSSRESIGAKMVPTSISGVRTALIELRKSKLITIASDQVPINKKSGLISNFFGVPSLSTTLVHSLASKVDCPVHTLTCLRKSNGIFQMIYSEELKDFGRLSQQEGVDIMNKELEKCIMNAPEQYAWEYKKYKHSTQDDLYK